MIKIGDMTFEIMILLVSIRTTLAMWGGIDAILTLMQLAFILTVALSIADDMRNYKESLRDNRARHQAEE